MSLSETIKIDNETVLVLLFKISDYILSNKDLLIMADSFSVQDSDIDCVSEQYLHEHCLGKDIDFAEYENVINLSKVEDRNLEKLINNLKHYLGVNDLSIAALYPKNSKLSWHHNGNAAGDAVLFSYSIDGKGYFRYYDKSTNAVIDVMDDIGWFAKLVSYGDPKLVDTPAWHCAETENYRISIGFKIPKSYRKRLMEIMSNKGE